MLTKELKIFFRNNKMVTILICFVLTSLMVIFGAFFSFYSHLNNGIKDLGLTYENKKIYQIFENYYMPGEFEEFFYSDGALKSLKGFYNALNENKDFKYLAVFDQHVLVNSKDTRIPVSAINRLGMGFSIIDDKEFIAMPSMQFNEQTLKYFNLTVSEGNLFTSEDFNSSNEYIPILLGSNYNGYFKIGEKLSINFYGENLNVKIMGFLSPNSKIFYQNEIEYYLDDYFILPYINYKEPLTEQESVYQKRMYFSMINGYIVTEDSESEAKSMMDYVEIIANKNGIEKYGFIGLNPHYQQYNGLMKSMQANSKLVQSILILIFVITILFINLLLIVQQNKRLPNFAVHLLNGATKKQIIRQFLIEIGSISLFSYFISILIFKYYLKFINIEIYFYLLLLMILIVSLSVLYPISRIKKIEITSFLRAETQEERN